MPRSGEDVRRRLQEAALVLFRAHGYEAVTAAEIAAEAGVTERTFFRHFPDKREVLFAGQDGNRAALARAIAEAPESTAPLAVLVQAFRAMQPVLALNRPFAQPRAEIIASNPGLRERELAKFASFQQIAAESLAARGIPPRQAVLAAQVGMAAFGQVLQRWMTDPDADFDALLTEALHNLRELVLQ
ncbi:TetR/AcrR family transcriptional regulator [Kutzneria sp. NPDC052558]|uniref:TetR/AcrR family transcriptional regulator n=1 Tax=Kutzneria sp. NPDC052558 TaxID=3364121 RepID=UPI0037C8C2BA